MCVAFPPIEEQSEHWEHFLLSGALPRERRKQRPGIALFVPSRHNGSMSDRVCLSLWLKDFTAEKMLPLWEKVLAAFPVSSLAPGLRELSIYPFRWGETPVLQQSFPEGAAASDAVALAAEFLHDDYAYEVELNWDVWAPRQPGALDQWERVPRRVSVACLGPRFEGEDTEDHPHILLDLGLDSLFLPEEAEEGTDAGALAEALEGMAGTCYRDNIAQLLSYAKKLEETLPVARRLLWSSSGEDLAARIQAAYS